tara:strand:- start:303 stop:479 length:177 start_codon:yes stop_codon:yes gene_type:complete
LEVRELIMKTYLVTVSGTIEKQYLVEAKNKQEAEENYKNGEEGDHSVIEEFVVEVELK